MDAVRTVLENVVAGIMGGSVVVFVTWIKDIEGFRAKLRVDWMARQLEDLYGPLYVLLLQPDKDDATTPTQHREKIMATLANGFWLVHPDDEVLFRATLSAGKYSDSAFVRCVTNRFAILARRLSEQRGVWYRKTIRSRFGHIFRRPTASNSATQSHDR